MIFDNLFLLSACNTFSNWFTDGTCIIHIESTSIVIYVDTYTCNNYLKCHIHEEWGIQYTCFCIDATVFIS